MDLDLNIENYNLQEILNLFKLSLNFNDVDLKNAKKYVCKLHPDKCKLPKEYFIFFAKAYKYVEQIYEFRKRKNSENTEYDTLIDDDNSLYDKVSEISKRNDFHNWFNKMFEEHQIKENDNGYEEWLKGDNNIHYDEASNTSQLQSNFHKYKTSAMKDIVVHKDINDICNNISTGGSVINKQNINDYSNNDIFSNKLNFNDVKRAHTESFIPVTENDYKNRTKYNNEMELKIERGKSMYIPSMEESNKIIKEKRTIEDNLATKDAYDLLKHQEEQNKQNELFMKNLRLLK